ncbi:MAG: YdcF family protein [Candidatus Saccharibacteria bacterium]
MRYFIIFPVLLIGIIVGLSLFLQPDDLRNCNDRVTTLKPCLAVDAIVAVSGGDTNARTDEAIRLFKNGWSNILIFSGAAQDKSGPSNAAVMKARAIASGVPKSAIVLDETSATTQQNAENSETLFTERNIKSIILVTSGYHQRRASLEFNKTNSGVKVLNHPVARDQDWSVWWWTYPRGWGLAISEFFKIIVFSLGISR